MSPATDSLRGRMVRDAGGTLGVRLTSAALALVSTLVLTRLLGASGFGAYAWAYTGAVALAVVATAGLNQFAVREIAAARALGEAGGPDSLARRGAWIVLAGAGVIVALAAIVVPLVEGDERLVDHLLLALPLIPLLALTTFAQGCLYGLGRVVAGLAIGTLLRQAVFLAAIGAAYAAVGGDLGSRDAVGLQVAAALVALVASGLLLRASLPRSGRIRRAPAAAREWLRSSVPMGLAGGLASVSAALPIAALGAIAGQTEAGIYAVAAQLTLPFSLLYTAARNPLAPALSGLWATDDVPRLRRAVTSATRGLFGLTLVAALALAVLAEPLLSLFGDGFSSGASALRLILVGVIVNSGLAFNGLVLMMTGHQNAAAGAAVGALLVQAAFSAALIPPLGVDGAALAYTLSVIVRNAVNSTQAWRCLRVDTSPIGLN